MKLIVGIGNPGQQYQKTRHNLGFLILEKLKAVLDFENFQVNKKYKALISQGKFGNQKIILAKPLTYVNESGQSVLALAKFYKIKPKDIIIVRDDIDLAIGKIKEKKNSGSGGHKGIESIINYLKSKDFTQIKIGVREPILEKMDPSDFVLKKFTKEKEKEFEKIGNKVLELINFQIQ